MLVQVVEYSHDAVSHGERCTKDIVPHRQVLGPRTRTARRRRRADTPGIPTLGREQERPRSTPFHPAKPGKLSTWQELHRPGLQKNCLKHSSVLAQSRPSPTPMPSSPAPREIVRAVPQHVALGGRPPGSTRAYNSPGAPCARLPRRDIPTTDLASIISLQLVAGISFAGMMRTGGRSPPDLSPPVILRCVKKNRTAGSRA